MEKLPRVDVYSQGSEVLFGTEAQKESITVFKQYIEEIERSTTAAFVCFDVDGTLIPSQDYATGSSMPFETTKNAKTVEEYVSENTELVEVFKSRILSLQKFGFKFMINTGRGVAFTQRLVDCLFPKGAVSVIVCESGAGILESDDMGQWKEQLTKPDTVHAEDYEILSQYKESIEGHACELSGTVESGKRVIVSINPPSGTTTEIFENTLKERLFAAGIPTEKLHITRSGSAVDIGPKGASKINSLKQVLGENMSIYFGDAKNDIEAMQGSLVNVVVGNAEASVQEVAKEAKLGLVVHPEYKDISGSTEGLRSLELLIRFVGMRRG